MRFSECQNGLRRLSRISLIVKIGRQSPANLNSGSKICLKTNLMKAHIANKLFSRL